MSKIDYTIRIRELDDGRFESSIVGTDYRSHGRSVDDAFTHLMICKETKAWYDKQNEKFREQYPEYFK